MGKIAYSELMEKLNDPDVSTDEIRKYFTEVPNPEQPFSPSFQIDESKVDLSEAPVPEAAREGFAKDIGVGFLNWQHRQRRQRSYERRIRKGWAGLRFVADGDSWFQYPWKRNDDLIDYLAVPFAIYCISAAGDELQNMLSKKNRARIAEVIRNTEAHGFLFSGGGNDIAGDEFVTFIRNAEPSESPDDYIGENFDPFLERIEKDYRGFFSDLFGQFSDLKIFYHGYDHALPVSDGGWLGPSLSKKQVPQSRWADIVRVMIDRYNAKLSNLAGEFSGRVYHVSCIGTIRDQWRDELHGKPEACERAAGRFKDKILNVWPESGVEASALEMASTPEIKTAIESAAKEATDPPALEVASEEQIQEGDIIPDDDVGLDSTLGEMPSSLESGIEAIPPISWPKKDENAPDYSHLDAPPAGRDFDLNPNDLELLIQANHFDPQGHDGTIVFGLRGAELVSGHQVEQASSIRLKDVRPNHLTYRCVIGFYDRAANQLSAYTASTVPNALSMTRYYKWQNGLSNKERWANMLPTGCYSFRRASHGWSNDAQKWKVPIALRLTLPGSEANDGTATVLRTKNDLTYGTADLWHTTVPTDNVHPAFSTTTFSSAGCLTIRGSNERFTNTASAQWARFLSRISRIPKNGRIDLLLLTGAEGLIASQLRNDGVSHDEPATLQALQRLRVGSKGESVRCLQEFLGVTADGIFGPGTKIALTEKQKSVEPVGKADGIYSPQMDAIFRQNILTPRTT